MILQSFLLGLGAATTFGVADFVAVAVARRIGTMSILVWSHIGGLLVSTPYLLLKADIHTIPVAYWPFFGILAVLILVALTSFYKAVQTSPISLVSPIVSAHLVVVILLSVTFMGERTGTVQLVGISLTLAGVVLASMTVSSPHASRPNLSKGIVLSITAMLGGGLFIFGIGNLSNELGWFLPIYIVRLCTFTVLLPTNLMMQGLSWRGLLPSSHVLTAILVGVLQFTGLAAYAMGAQIGPVSVAAASFSVYPVIPVVGGLILFKERLAPRQTVGIASALGGLAILGLAT